MTLQASWSKKELNVADLRTGLDRFAAALGMEIKLRVTEPGRRHALA